MLTQVQNRENGRGLEQAMQSTKRNMDKQQRHLDDAILLRAPRGSLQMMLMAVQGLQMGAIFQHMQF